MPSAEPFSDTGYIEANPEKLTYMPRRCDPVGLTAFAARCLTAVGVGSADAELTARVLVDADLHGSETHGIALLYTHYVQALRAGDINPRPDVTVAQGSPVAVSVDGDRGLGILVSHRAMNECIRMAEQYGCGWATVFNSTHSGAGAFYVRMAAERRMAGFHWSTGGSTIAVPGGSGRLLGNNPFSFAAPGGSNGPIVLDMAPSTTIRPKIRLAAWRGEDLPDGWAVDDDGRPITDPSEFFAREGAILPLGGSLRGGVHKGYGLLLMSDILTGALSGDGGSLLRQRGVHSHAFCALDISAFPTGGSYERTIEAMIERLHQAPAQPGERVRLPGEHANKAYRERSRDGIPIRRYLAEELETMASELAVSTDGIWIEP
jgi:L-2-hydroxycarboxylate dehydrogenase (NAD+)